MTAAWATYPAAPDIGTRICALSDLPDGEVVARDIAGFGVLLFRRGKEVGAFVNACPHQYLPLDYRAKAMTSADGTRVLCTNHDAAFDAETGEGVAGFGIGCNLDPVPVRVTATGDVSIG